MNTEPPQSRPWPPRRSPQPQQTPNRAEHWRAAATCYDKLAITYRAAFVLALIIEWLKSLGDLGDLRCSEGSGRNSPATGDEGWI